MDVCLRVLKESNKSRFASYSVRDRVFIISHLNFRDFLVHIFSDNLSQNTAYSSSSSVGCRAGDYELPPATTILCQFRQLARANHVVCVSQKVFNVSEKQGSLPSWFPLPMWWNMVVAYLMTGCRCIECMAPTI